MRCLSLSAILAVAVLTACSRKDAADGVARDSTSAATAAPEPRNPHVMSFDFGRAVDSLGGIFGGVSNRFSPRDTVFVAVRTQFAPAGAKLGLRLRQGGRTVDSTSGATRAPDSTGVSATAFHFVRAAGWSRGSYQVEVFLDGTSQGVKDLEVIP